MTRCQCVDKVWIGFCRRIRERCALSNATIGRVDLICKRGSAQSG
ncbi:DUF3331 domain-containing protein [Paraburkholderia agricolaris]|uniref:DUF3331 domain-containing protein n=1 Tax=Paraburkholderia agricolaris TaxID=2152888 RepID=A0ABW8ZWD3_9BURK